jgi:hypothetical protein
MIKRKHNKKTINDQKETEQKDFQLSKGNRIKKTINDQREKEQKDYQWSKGNRTVLFTFDH